MEQQSNLQARENTRSPMLHSIHHMSVAQNLYSELGLINGFFFRKPLLQHFRGLRVGFRAPHSAHIPLILQDVFVI